VIDPRIRKRCISGRIGLWQTVELRRALERGHAHLTGGTIISVTAIAVAPSDSNTVYVGQQQQNASDRRYAEGAKAVFFDRSAAFLLTITHIAVDPVDAATAYVTFSGFRAQAIFTRPQITEPAG